MSSGRRFSFSSLFFAAFLFALAQQLYGLARYDQTYDEYWHISWNERFFETGEAERDSASNYNSPTPILGPNFAFLRLMWGNEVIQPPVKLKTLRYWQTFWLFIITGATVWAGTLLRDRELGWLFGTFLLLEPNLLAHSAVITVDLPCAATVLVQAAAAMWYIATPTATRALFLGLCAGLAITAKFTAVLLLPTYALLPLFVIRRVSVARLVLHFFLALGIGCGIICAFYGFEQVWAPLSSFTWKSAPLAKISAVFPELRLPLPGALLTGIDRTFEVERHQIWNVLLLGRSYPDGSFLFFPLLWLLKTPIALLGFMVVGWFYAARSTMHWRTAAARFFLFQTFILTGYFLFLFRTQVGYRHALAFLPLLIAIAAFGWSARASATRFSILVLLAVLAVVEVLPFSGNLLAFSNLMLRPKAEAYRYFADSNIDWGQNRERLAAYIIEQVKRGAAYNPVHILAGRNIIDVNTFAGVWWNFSQHRWARAHLRPVEAQEHTLLVFDVSEAEFSEFLSSERTLSEDRPELGDCQASTEFQTLRAGDVEIIPPGTKGICIEATEKSAFSVSSAMTPIIFGPRQGGDACRREQIAPTGKAWYVLESGKFGFCVENNSDLTRLEIKSGELRVSMQRPLYSSSPL